MKLKFKKENEDIDVVFVLESDEREFKYIDMIESLYNKEKFDEPEFSTKISEEEKTKILDMIARINKMISNEGDQLSDEN